MLNPAENRKIWMKAAEDSRELLEGRVKNDIEKYRGKDLLVTRDNAVKLEENENFIVDLIGIKVVTDEGQELGTLTDVLLTGANDVYEVDTGSKKILLPAIPSCILDVDLDKQTMLVHVLDGLLDL